MADNNSGTKDKTNFKSVIIIAAVFLAAFGFGLLRIAPVFNADDSPETTTAFYTLGIQHPPGYPLDTLIGKIFTLIPAGNIMYRSNITALFFHVVSSFLVFFFALKCLATRNENDTKQKYFAVLSAVLYYLCFTPFCQALSAKGSIYTINALFTVLFFWGLFKIQENKKYVLFAAFIYGLSMANHWPSMAAVFPAALFYLVMKRKYLSASILIQSLIFFLTGASVYLFVFVRSAEMPVFAWGDIGTFRDLLWLFSREQYRYAESSHTIAQTFILFGFYIKSILLNEYAFLTVLLFIPGAYFIIRRSRDKGIAICTAYLSILAGVIFISTPKHTIEWVIKPYFTSSYIFISVLIGACVLSLVDLVNIEQEKNRNNIIIAVIAAVAILSIFHVPDYSRNFIGYDYAGNIMATLPEKAVFFTEGDLNMSSGLYESFVEKRDFVAINTRLLEYDWYRRQLKNDYGDRIILPAPADSGILYLYNTMLINAKSGIYYSNAYTPEWQRLPFAPMGIINKVITDPKEKTAANGNYFQIYSYRGLIGNKIDHDESTDLLAAKHYAWSLITFAEMLKNSGHYPEAVKMYKDSEVFEPKDTTLTRIGLCYYNMKDLQNAEKYWQEAIDINPESSQAYTGLAFIYLNSNDITKAAEYVNNALKYDPKNQDAVKMKEIIDKNQSVIH